jgi:hypothetical protein
MKVIFAGTPDFAATALAAISAPARGRCWCSPSLIGLPGVA